jgi:hypothetical protein
MKKTLIIFAFFLMAGISGNLMAQTSATVTGTTAGAVLIKAMTLTETAPLHFGSIVLTTTAGGTVVLPSNSTTRSFTGGCATSAATPVATNAAYNVTGTINETYALTLPATTTVTHTTVGTGVNTMDITLMKARFTNTPGSDAVVSTLDASGNDSFTVGGTLTVQANQLGGIYAGTFNVTVDYN